VGSKTDPFRVTEAELAAFSEIVEAASACDLALVTGTYRHRRAAFLCVKKGRRRRPIAILVRTEDLPVMRNSELRPILAGRASDASKLD
jgi:hypothetical protein